MFESKQIRKHFSDIDEFKQLSEDSFLIVGDSQNRNTWLWPYRDFEGKIVRHFLCWYVDMLYDAGKDFCNRQLDLGKNLTKALKKANMLKSIKDREKEELLRPLKITHDHLIDDYDTFINFRFRLQLLVKERDFSRRNLKVVDRNISIDLMQGMSARAKFYVKRSHTIYQYGIHRFLINSGLTKRFFKGLQIDAS